MQQFDFFLAETQINRFLAPCLNSELWLKYFKCIKWVVFWKQKTVTNNFLHSYIHFYVFIKDAKVSKQREKEKKNAWCLFILVFLRSSIPYGGEEKKNNSGRGSRRIPVLLLFDARPLFFFFSSPP